MKPNLPWFRTPFTPSCQEKDWAYSNNSARDPHGPHGAMKLKLTGIGKYLRVSKFFRWGHPGA